jgi:hypothetical protein
MSSLSLSVSGARPLSTTVNDPSRTAASMPTKPGDMLSISMGTVREARIVLPAANVRVERYKGEDGAIVQVLVMETNPEHVHASLSVSLEALPGSGHPHGSINARKEPEDHEPFAGFIGSRELDDTIDLAIPPTE